MNDCTRVGVFSLVLLGGVKQMIPAYKPYKPACFFPVHYKAFARKIILSKGEGYPYDTVLLPTPNPPHHFHKLACRGISLLVSSPPLSSKPFPGSTAIFTLLAKGGIASLLPDSLGSPPDLGDMGSPSSPDLIDP